MSADETSGVVELGEDSATSGHHLSIWRRASDDGWRAECRTCAWVGRLRSRRVLAEREAEQHERVAS